MHVVSPQVDLDPASHGLSGTGHELLGSGLWAAFRAEAGTYGLGTRLFRSLRRSHIIGRTGAFHELVRNEVFQCHVARDTVADPFFFLSHPYYLARGLSARDRILSALTHYRHEQTAFDRSYHEDVYQKEGLILWSQVVDGVLYEIRLQAGNDVLYEGGTSIVLFVKGVRVCVLSCSMVPRSVLWDSNETTPILFVTRYHLTQDRTYQAAFNHAFNRCMPGHLCFAALSALVTSLGQMHVFGIEPKRHPSWSKERNDQFTNIYAGFWQSLSGRKVSDLGYLIDLPLHLSPLDQMDAARRKRAAERRRHIDAVTDSAVAVISSHLNSPARH